MSGFRNSPEPLFRHNSMAECPPVKRSVPGSSPGVGAEAIASASRTGRGATPSSKRPLPRTDAGLQPTGRSPHSPRPGRRRAPTVNRVLRGSLPRWGAVPTLVGGQVGVKPEPGRHTACRSGGSWVSRVSVGQVREWRTHATTSTTQFMTGVTHLAETRRTPS